MAHTKAALVLALVLAAVAAPRVLAEDNRAAEVDDLPAEVPDDEGGAFVVDDEEVGVIELAGMKQWEAVNAAAVLNQKVIKYLGAKGVMKHMPYEIDLRPPPLLLNATVGVHLVDVHVYKTEADADNEVFDTYTFSQEVFDVNECTDTDLPAAWQHKCSGTGDYNVCRNEPLGSYSCHCFEGTIGTHPCEGSPSSDACDPSCKNTLRAWETKCHEGFKCQPIDECDDDATNDCHAMAVCADVPCPEFAGYKEDPITCKDSYTCTPRDGYEGPGLGAEDGCADIDECATKVHDCDRHAICTNEAPTDENDWTKFTCECMESYTGDGRTCHATELCAAVERDSICHSWQVGSKTRSARCEHCLQEEDGSVCEESPAHIEEHGTFKCVCPEHYEGNGFNKRAEGDAEGCTVIDYCTHALGNDCNAHSKCVNDREGAYHCDCHGGFEPKEEGSGAHGPDGCVNINECLDFNQNDCHVNAKCSDLTPTAADVGTENGRYDCKCRAAEGYKPNSPPAARAAFGPDGCKDDDTPAKAFLMCGEELRHLDFEHDSVAKLAAERPTFAKCEPSYVSGPQKEAGGHQTCECENGKNIYSQYSTYDEFAIAVRDDSENKLDLATVTNYHNLPVKGDGSLFFEKVGTYDKAVKYVLRPKKQPGKKQVKADMETWYRKIVVTPVDECVSTTIPERFRHQCREMASCLNTDPKYGCACFEGTAGDGYLVAPPAGYPAHQPGAEGCTDIRPPVIELVGRYPLEVQECLCGDDIGEDEAPTFAKLASHGLGATAYDMVWTKDADGPQAGTNGSRWALAKRDVAVEHSSIVSFDCKDIPQSGDGLPSTVDFKPFDCVGVTAAYKVTYSAVDAAGNAAAPMSHFVIMRKIKVLQRLLELEEETRAQQARNEAMQTSLAAQAAQLARASDELTAITQRLALEQQATSSTIEEWVVRGVVSALALSVGFVLYHGMIPTILKMCQALVAPGSMSRHDFEDGYALYLRVRSFGFATMLDRAQSTEEAWAAVEDTQ